jgi:hypothetical protein
MTQTEFITIHDQPCRFKLKSGKEVYGVIWENPRGTQNYFFASLSERNTTHNSAIGILIQLDDVVGAELLRDVVVKAG